MTISTLFFCESAVAAPAPAGQRHWFMFLVCMAREADSLDHRRAAFDGLLRWLHGLLRAGCPVPRHGNGGKCKLAGGLWKGHQTSAGVNAHSISKRDWPIQAIEIEVRLHGSV